MSNAPGLGWWQASDGQWYPPELHPNWRPHALAQAEHTHLRHHAQHVQPTHARPGAGSYTIEPVTTASHGIGLVLIVLAVLLGVALLTGVLVLLLRQGGV